MVDEQHAVEMIHLVLDAGREQTLGRQLADLALVVEIADLDGVRPGHVGIVLGQRQAALVVGGVLVGNPHELRIGQAIGLRRFALFPPEQIGNLYVGPLDYAPTGTPISMVSLSQPDFERFPRFREALAAAQVAELGPGDAIYIPPLWWHHVQSLGAFNMLVNYWWTGTPGSQPVIDSAQDCLLHSLLSLRSLPPEQRAAWRVFFDHYVFGDAGEAAAHIPAHRQGVLGPVSPEMARQVRAFLAGKLKA